MFSSILVPAITNGPSLTTLQWSEDGQAFIVTRSAIYILTPNTGITFEPSSVISSSFVQPPDKNLDFQPLGWYRTMIELEKTPVHQWALESQEWNAVSFGSLDVSWCSVTLSPSSLSQESSCLLAVLNTNLEVSLWAPGKNYLTEEWTKIQDVTQALRAVEPISSSALSRTLNAQVHSISWSRQVNLGEGVHHIDGSLLAMGNRAGNVTFMQLSSAKDGQVLQHVATVDVSDDWIHHLAWSAWKMLTPDHFQANLACGVPDGGIVIISVSLFVDHASLTRRFHFELQCEGKSCCIPDKSAITALTWVESTRHAPILAYIKPGIVCLQTFPSDLPLGWINRCALALKPQPLSPSSSPYVGASGFVYYEDHNALIVCLHDGSLHVIHGVSTSPSVYLLDQRFSSEELTRQVRSIFGISEGAIDFADAYRTSGLCDYDGAGTIMWLHEKCNLNDFSYKHDAKHASMFIVAQLWRDEFQFFERLTSHLTGNHNFDITPVHALRGALLQLRDSKFFEFHQDRLFELLTKCYTTYQITSTQAFSKSQDCDGQFLRQNFRRRLAIDLFRTQSIRSLRVGFVLTAFCSSVRQMVSPPFQTLLQEFLKSILCAHLQAVIRQVKVVIDQLEDIDRSFVHRWITLSMAQGSPHLRDEAVALAQIVGVSSDSPLESLEFLEECPACRGIIPLETSSVATCPNGHIWARCSITSFLLATPFVRTCVGCNRKALLPLSLTNNNGLLPPAASSWLAQELLETARRCVFCGNRFVRVL